MRKKDKARLSKVAELGCAICRRLGLGITPAQVHHPRGGMGIGQRAGDDEAIPLCLHHHLGPKGVHDIGRGFESHYGFSEQDLVIETKRLLGELGE